MHALKKSSVFSRVAWILPLFFYVLFLASCDLNTANSFQNDQACSGTRDYCTFVAILKKESHGCFECHANGGEGGGEWQTFDAINDWVAAGLITRGDGAGSQIITILKPAGDMPRGANTSVSDSEKQKIIDYIDSL
jgi:hypothetical protein